MPVLKDGYQSLISLGGTVLKEKTVTPPSIEGGGAIDTTTMRNENNRTKAPKQLKSYGDSTFTAAYDPQAYETLLDQLLVVQEITVTFPDGSTIAFWGWLEKFAPAGLDEGNQPIAECLIIPSMADDQDAEADMEYTAPSGP